MSHLRIFPPVVEIYPNDRQLFTVEADPPPAMWFGVTDSGDIKSDFSLEVDPAGSTVSGGGAHLLLSGIGIVELTVDDQCRPTSSNELIINGFVNDLAGFLYVYSIKITSTTVKVFNEAPTEIFTETYSTVSGDVYRLEMSTSGFQLYRNDVLKHSRIGLATTVNYPMRYQMAITEPTAAAPTRIPSPRLIGDWHIRPIAIFTTPSHGALTTVGPAGETEYFGGTQPGIYTLVAAIEAAADAGGVQSATATINIPPLLILSSPEITMPPGQKARFKTNYDKAQTIVATWEIVSGEGTFTQGEFTAPALAGDTIARAVSALTNQVADLLVTVPPVITNPSNFLAAKPSEQIDFATNIPVFPTFVSAGPIVAGVGAVTPLLPPRFRLSDILLLFVETAQQTVAAPSGWTEVADSPQGFGTAGDAAASRITVFWRRVTAIEAAPVITDPGDHVVAQILAFRTCHDTGNPWDVTAGNSDVSGTAVSIPGDTTTVPNCLIVQTVCNGTDTAASQTSGYANGDLAGLVELTDTNTTEGNGGGFAVVMGQKAAAGAFGSTTATLATASVQGRLTIALKPAITTWLASIGSINSSSGLWTAPSLAGQVAKITATNGTTTVTIEVPVLEVFPIDPSAPIKWDRRKTVLVNRAEDRARTSRVKDNLGLSFEAWEITIENLEVTDVDTLGDFFDAHHPAKKFIFEDDLRTLRKVVYFDSDITFEAASDCSVRAVFRIIEA